jgi:lysophospholipase L1-like esterase
MMIVSRKSVLAFVLGALLPALLFADQPNTPAKSSAPNRVVRVLPLGDSITGVNGAYRKRLCSLIAENGLKVDMVGKYKTPADATWDADHCGIGGKTIEWIQSVCDGSFGGWRWVREFKPDIVLLMIGTNDIIGNRDLANAPARLGSLVDVVCADLPPGAKLYVGTIVPSGWGRNPLVVEYNRHIPEIVKTRADAGKPVYLVDIYSSVTFPDDFLKDQVHPTDAGFEKIAARWFQAIKGDLQTAVRPTEEKR